MDLRDDAGPHFVNSPDLKNKRDGKDIWAQRGYIWATADQKKNTGDFRCKHGSGLNKERGAGRQSKDKKSQKKR